MSNSNKESVFLQSNGNSQFQDLLTSTSAPNWSKVSNEAGALTSGSIQDPKKIMSEINNMLSEVRKSNMAGGSLEVQDGGAKKKKVKSKSKSSKKVKKSSSAKKLKRSKSKSKSSKKTKKASSSKKSKSHKKQHGGEEKKKREMPQALKDMRTLAEVIKGETDLKDGIPMVSTANKIIKAQGGLDNATEWVKGHKSEVKKIYNQIVEEQKKKREAKKAEKAKNKGQESSSEESESE